MRVVLAASLLALVACTHTSGELALHHLRSGGVGRTWYEFRPTHLPDRPPPLVVLLHGYSGRSLDMLGPTGIADLARSDGFVVAIPDSVGPGWNAGTCCGDSTRDDVSFVAQVISSMVSERSIDASRVYIVGFSNGAMLAYRIGCQLAGAVTGIEVVEGTMTAPCPSHGPVNLLVVHQLGDAVVPYGGTATPQPGLLVGAPFASVPAAVAVWEQAEGCQNAPVTGGPGAKAQAFCPSGATIEVDVIQGGAHVWPAEASSEMETFFRLRP